MKGILKSNNNDWFVWYTDIKNVNVYNKVLPLIRDFSNWVYYNPEDGLEVEFEIVEMGYRGNEDTFPRSYNKEKYAKLISKPEELPESKVTRLEVIDHNGSGVGRAYSKHGINSLELSYQDDGKTLKIFIK